MSERQGSSSDEGRAQALAQLTRREIECLALVSTGRESKEIAPLLGIEPGTVDVTLKRAGRRVGVSGRKQLARMLADHAPEMIQSTIQRLVQDQKSLVSAIPAAADGVVAVVEEPASLRTGLPFPTPKRQWNDLPTWQRRAWAVAVALGAIGIGLLLTGLSRHMLVAVSAH